MRRAILGSSPATIPAVAYLWPSSALHRRKAAVSVARCAWRVMAAARDSRRQKRSRSMLRRNASHSIPTSSSVQQRRRTRLRRKNPALLAQLHCYCGCDQVYGHQNLLDCYRGDHGSKCEICIGEALMAEQLWQQGSPVDQIRDAIRRNYAGER